MKDVEEIRQRCFMQDGHWLWRGGSRPDGRPSIHAPDYTLGGMRTQCGTRAVWHCITGKAIAKGYRVFGTCEHKQCINPAHLICVTSTKFGSLQAAKGVLKGNTARILANRAIGRARTKLTPDLVFEIQTSEETGLELAARLGISKSVISKVRTTGMPSIPAAGMFSGLMRMGASA